jgi:hypothetical protein
MRAVVVLDRSIWRRGRDSNPGNPVKGSTVFETVPINRSGTSPHVVFTPLTPAHASPAEPMATEAATDSRRALAVQPRTGPGRPRFGRTAGWSRSTSAPASVEAPTGSRPAPASGTTSTPCGSRPSAQTTSRSVLFARISSPQRSPVPSLNRQMNAYGSGTDNTASTSASLRRSGGRSWTRGRSLFGMGLRSSHPMSSHQRNKHRASAKMCTTVSGFLSCFSSQSRYTRRSSFVTLQSSLYPMNGSR